MAEIYQNTPLNAETVAADVDRKQNQRLLIAGIASVATNVLFLIGAANGMSEKPLSLEEPPPAIMVFTAIASPAPVAPVKPVSTPAPKVAVAKADAAPTPAPRRPQPADTPTPRRVRTQVAQVRPRVRPVPPREVTPPRENTPREAEPTPPPARPVEETVAETRRQNVETNRTRGAETQVAASGPRTNSNTARRAANNSGAASNAGAASSASGGQRARVAQGVAGGSATNPGDFAAPNATRNNATGAPSLRTGIAGGSDAAGVSGIVGETRSTGAIIGSAGNVSGPTLANGSGPKLGNFGGKAGSRDKILTQSESAGGAAEGDFTVAKGTGLRPGAIVARTGPAAGGAAGTLSNATLGARVSGGNGSGSGGAETLGVFKRSTGPGGGSGGPVGLRVGTGPGAGRGTGAMSGVTNGDAGGVSGQGLAGGNGAPGRGDARSNGAGGSGSGSGVAAGSTRGGNGNGIGDDGSGGNGKGNGRGPNTGPGRGSGGLATREGGVGAGTGGSGTGAGEFGVKNGAGSGASINSKGTGTATGAGRTNVAIEARGNKGAGIVAQKVGQQEDRSGSGPIQVKSDDKPDNRKVSGPTATALGGKVDIAGFTAKTNARATRSPRPRITDEMKAAARRSAVVEFTIGSNGSASYRLTTSSGSADVDAAVLAAAAGYRWTAATSGGTPVSSKQIITFNPNE